MSVSLYKGNTSPSIRDTIRVDGAAFNLTNCTVSFRMRVAGATTLKVDAAATPVSAAHGQVRYDWQPADTDTPGDYLAWWSVELPSSDTQDTQEFEVRVLEHAAASEVPPRFANVDDLATRLGLELDAVEQERAVSLIELASGLIQDEAKQQIALVEDDVLTMRGTNDETVRLPERPVVSVASVKVAGRELVEGTDWVLEGDKIVRLGFTSLLMGSIVDGYQLSGFRGFGSPRQTLEITYTHGYSDVPRTVKAICLEAVVRVWVNPGSVAQERVGDTSVMYTSSVAGGLTLTTSEKSALRRLFGRSATSVTIGR